MAPKIRSHGRDTLLRYARLGRPRQRRFVYFAYFAAVSQMTLRRDAFTGKQRPSRRAYLGLLTFAALSMVSSGGLKLMGVMISIN